MFRAGLVLLPLALLVSCFSADGSAEADYGKPMLSPRSEMMEFEVAAADSVAPVPMNAAGKANVQSAEIPTAASDRKRIYNGSAGLIVDDTETVRQNIESLAVDSGGYVENSYRDYVVIRVPAERFEELFETVLEAGAVDFSRIESYDVTDEYSDLQGHIDTARETRERLYALLEQSTDPQEKARILREIGRLTEEITLLEQQMQLMADRIAFSRISVQLTPRNPGELSRSDIPFRWIANLDPLSAAGARLRARVELEPGSAWAVFSRDDIYLAENGNRDQIFISTVANNPRGDNDFWQKALIHYLSPLYRSAEPKSLSFGDSDLQGVEFVSKDREAFRYFVGVVADGRHLHVVEFFTPDQQQGFSELYEALERGELR